jgi:Tfp pilus assembly protein PilV
MVRLTPPNAFSLLEILLASVIFVVAVAGIFGTLSYVRKPVTSRESALSAAVFGKQVLEALRSQVSMAASSNYYSCSTVTSPCPDFALSVGQHQVQPAGLPVGLRWPSALVAKNNSCNAQGCLIYTVYCADNLSSTPPCSSNDVGRKVNLDINW